MIDHRSNAVGHRSGSVERALRRFGAAFAHIGSLDRFTEALEKAMSEAMFLREAVIHLAAEDQSGTAKDCFSSGSLVLPLLGNQVARGAVEVRSPGARRPYGPDELRLLSSLTSFCASLVEHALKHAEQGRDLAILRYIFDQLPVPVLACSESGRILILNARGAACLRLSKSEPGYLGSEIHSRMLAACEKNGASSFGFFVALPGQLMKATVSPCPPLGTMERVYCMTIMDLTQERERLRQGLFREAFRCRWLNKPLTRITLRNSENPMALIEMLPLLRHRLGSDDRAGPWEEDALALAFPEITKWQALTNLREWLRTDQSGEMTVGVAMMEAGSDHPEEIGESDGEEIFRLKEMLRPAILLHDENPEVNDALEYALRGDFQVVKSHCSAATLGHLAERRFDGLIIERYPRDGVSGVDLARRAAEFNPGIQVFFTGAFAEGTCSDLKNFERLPVAIPKPFRVDRLLALVRECLDGRGPVS